LAYLRQLSPHTSLRPGWPTLINDLITVNISGVFLANRDGHPESSSSQLTDLAIPLSMTVTGLLLSIQPVRAINYNT
jgi:hypothetical protein